MPSSLPDFDAMEDEIFPPLPPPQSPGLGGQDEAGDPFNDEEGDVSKLADVPAAKRKGVKRPQPKLDSVRLTSERGLPALRTLFDDVRFKGKGHEAENLRLMLQKMENWAHRLFPKLQFEDFIDRVEKLGAKKEVQTCLKRIRLDMPLTHEDFTGNDGEPSVPPESHVFGDPDPFNDLPMPIHSTPAPAPAAPPSPYTSYTSYTTPTTPAPPAPPAPPTPALTEEQRQRMELNRRRALEKKLARQQQQQQQTDPSPSQTDDSTAAHDQTSEDVLNHSATHQETGEEEVKKMEEKEEEEAQGMEEKEVKKMEEKEEEEGEEEKMDLDVEPVDSSTQRHQEQEEQQGQPIEPPPTDSAPSPSSGVSPVKPPVNQ